MRLLTHNTLMNNAADAKGKGFPLRITAAVVKVDDNVGRASEERQISFVKGILPTLQWDALVQASQEMGVPGLPPTLTEDLAGNPEFCVALYHVLMHVHLIQGMLTCPVTDREFPVQDGIPNMMIEETEAPAVRL
ncbi:hypothetical protein ACA910_019927 [Epithemia clementina (nom. ined.)]